MLKMSVKSRKKRETENDGMTGTTIASS